MLKALLAPRSIAVVGASRRESAIGHEVLRNLIAGGFTGAVYPVNPGASSVCSVRAYPSIAALPEVPDVAVVVVPKEHVLGIAEECGTAGVRGLIVISSGFREVNADGAARERELLAVVQKHGMRMVGPNCMGIINNDPAISMNATFAHANGPFGHAAFVSQSGALGLSVLDYARDYGIGISQFVSVGNKADVSSNDLLEHWERDDSVRVILMYVESFGNPRKFLEIARRLTKTKPIIVVKSGRSSAGAKAAASHTGALAASDATVDAMLAQAGVLRAATVEELFDMAMAFEVRSLPKSRRTAVLTNAGGPGILAADAMEAAGLDLVDLDAATIDALRPLFPAEASIRNPLDMIASATPSGYQWALTALLKDPNIDAVVPIFVPPFGVKQEDVADAIAGAAATNTEKPVLAVLMGRDGLPAGRAELQRAQIPTYIFPESAARALATLNRQVEWAGRPMPVFEPLVGIDRPAAGAIIAAVHGDGREHLTQIEAIELLRCYGIPVARGGLATSADHAARLAADIGYPIVMKIVSADVIHKTEVGGVVIGIPSEPELRTAYEGMLKRVRSADASARIDGVLIQQTVHGSIETIVGVTRDPAFGPLLMFGLGGVLVEALRDVVFRVAPIDDDEARSMLRAIRAAALLDGVRGQAPANKDAIVSVIRRVGQLATDHPTIAELDVNPLVTTASGVVALDARVRVDVRAEKPSANAAHNPLGMPTERASRTG